jgi:hypothetical protein
MWVRLKLKALDIETWCNNNGTDQKCIKKIAQKNLKGEDLLQEDFCTDGKTMSK